MATIKNYGIAGVGANIQLGKNGGYFTFGSETFTALRADGSTPANVEFGQVAFNTLADGSITITGFVDEDTMASDSDTLIPTQQSVKAYVDSSLSVSGSSMNIVTDSGTGSIVFANSALDFHGNTNQITTSYNDGTDTITFSLTNTVVVNEIFASTVGVTGTVTFGSLSDGSITILGFIDEDNMASDSPNHIPTQQSVKAYIDSQTVTGSFDIGGDTGTDTVNLGEIVNFYGNAAHIVTAVTNNQVEISLVDGVQLTNPAVVGSMDVGNIQSASGLNIDTDAVITGNLTVQGSQIIVDSTVVQTSDPSIFLQKDTLGSNSGLDVGIAFNYWGSGANRIGFMGWDQSAGAFTIKENATEVGSNIFDGTTSTLIADIQGNVTGSISFDSLTDTGESITITKFVDEADGISNNDNDTTIPTSAAVIDYVASNSGDGLIVRGTATANGSASVFNIGPMPNVASRTYYANKVVIKVNTAFAGASFDHILVIDGNGSGTTLVAADDADAAATGTYVIELDNDIALAKNQNIQIQLKQSNGTTASAATAGSLIATVFYNYV